MKMTSLVLALAGSLISSAGALAQDWPSGPVRMIVGYPAGGTTDVVARLVSEELGERLGQPVLVENRAGAGGIVGASAVATASPDGSTFLFAASPEIAIAPATGRQMPFDPQEDLAPVSLVCTLPQMLVVNSTVPVETVEELKALAEEKPGTLNFASYGAGTSNHLVGELFKAETGLDIVHIPFAGSAPAMTDLLGGRVQMTFDTVSAVLAHVQSGDLKALGFASEERTSLLPEVPTLDEAGVPGFVGGSWVGILAPAETPKEIIQKMSEEVAAVVSSAEVKEVLADRGLPCSGTSPQEFADFIDAEIAKWTEVAERAEIKVE